jgi:hypothetical protein
MESSIESNIEGRRLNCIRIKRLDPEVPRVKSCNPGLICTSIRNLGVVAAVFGWMCATAVGQDDAAAMTKINPRMNPPLRIDEEVVTASGIQKLTGKHIDLYTDVRDRPDISELVDVFDQAVGQWCEYFSISPSQTAPWRMRAFVIEDRNRFKTAGLMPDDLPDFLAGFQRGHEIWIYVQPGDYYSRHLLLHEGTHAFMGWFLNGFGSPWYSEGTAELLGINQWQDGKLQLHHHLRDRSEAPYWGRVKIIRREFGEGTTLSLDEVLNISATAFRDVRFYAWSWAACEFLANHQSSRAVFGELDRNAALTSERFNAAVKERLSSQWETLNRDWYVYLSELDYGYDVGKGRLISANPILSDDNVTKFEIRADHSWQITSFAVTPGDRVRVTCGSRYQIGKSTKPWPCEANGITIEYYQGRPLGMLLAGVFDRDADFADNNSVKAEMEGLLQPVEVGQETIVQITKPGVLCFRVNESPAKMRDNQGVLEVTIEKLE